MTMFSRFSITGKIRTNSISKSKHKIKNRFPKGKRFYFFVLFYLPKFSGARGLSSSTDVFEETSSPLERDELTVEFSF